MRFNAPPLPEDTVLLPAAACSNDADNVDFGCLAGDDTCDEEEEATTFSVVFVTFDGDDPKDEVCDNEADIDTQGRLAAQSSCDNDSFIASLYLSPRITY